MSRLANMPITIPSAVKVTMGNSGCLSFTNGKVTETWTVHKDVKVVLEENKMSLSMNEKDRSNSFSRSMLGTDYRHVENIVKGLTTPFETVLEIHGLGYRARMTGNKVVLALGKSHDDEVEIPSNVLVEIPNEREVICKSHSKKLLGDFVAVLCFKRKPDAYKAKGVRIRGKHYRTKSEK